MNRKAECAEKLGRVRETMKRRKLSAALITEQANMSWVSGGGDFFISLASTAASGQILVTPKDAVCFAENIEAGRLAEEELAGTGIAVEGANWWEGKALVDKVKKFADPAKIGSDLAGGPFPSLTAELADLRLSLLDVEVERLRILGARAEKAMWETCNAVEHGMTEYEVAGVLAASVWAMECAPLVTLVAADERIAKYRHPIPQDGRIHERVMIVLCARMAGLIVSLTRIVCFHPPSRDLMKRHAACAVVDATLIANSEPGADCAGILGKGLKAYAAGGYSKEWQLHHQGGPAGYMAREIRVMPSTKSAVRVNQPLAWNPSITGTKSEDTIVALEKGPELVTFSLPWPAIEIEAEGRVWKRADLVQR